MGRLTASFFARDSEEVAKELIGRLIVREEGRRRMSGIIAETGAYSGDGRKGLEVGPGIIYIAIFTGGQPVLCIGTEAEEVKSVVTIRKLLAVEGLAAPIDGPAIVVRALRIDRSWNDRAIYGQSTSLWIEGAPAAPDQVVRVGPRQEKMAANCNAFFRLR